jgi:adenylate cyclase, class 2
MVEVEVKYRLPEPFALLGNLHAWGATMLEEQQHVDSYLSAPDRDFARTDEALRLRQIGEFNFLTYKGPRYDTTTKTRPELELSCGNGAENAQQFLRLFEYLGYKLVAQVRKQRRIYELHRDGFTIHCCLDDVVNVGNFVELEIVAEETNYKQARDLVFRLASELDLGQSETRSYLEMLLGQTVKAGGER